MQNESSTHGLNHERLAKLWKIGQDLPEEHPNIDGDQEKAELLREQLAESLPLNKKAAQLLPSILREVCEKFKPFMGGSIKDLLTDRDTDPLVAEAIKNVYREQAESAPSERGRQVATAIYYLAIAHALANHDVRITKFPYHSLSQSFEKLARSRWITPALKQLFAEARETCLRHMKQSEKRNEG